MKTLFLKSNILHIRTNEGEFEVSNPETAGIMQNGKFFLWHTDSNGGYKHTESEGVDCEWPGGVEIKNYCASDVCDTDGVCEHCREPKKLARLIPEESESAYKEVESSEPQEKYLRFEKELARKIIDLIFTEKYVFLGDYSDGYENPEKAFKDIIPIIHEAFKKSVSVPSESQEELARKAFDQLWDIIESIRNENYTVSDDNRKLIDELFTRKPE